MRRRRLLGLITAGAVLRTLPRAAADQKPARIAFLGVPAPSDPQFAPLWGVFVEALARLGWSEGRNLVIERRWAGGRPESYPQMAAELVTARPDLIVALSAQAMQAARRHTHTIPIVAIGSTDLVALRLVESLAHPGGNLTGFSVEAEGFEGKLVQMLREVRGALSRLAVLYTPSNPISKAIAEKEASIAAPMGIGVELIAVDRPEDLDAAFAALRRSTPEALEVSSTPVLFSHARQVAAFAIAHGLPTICQWDAMVRDGLLLSYSPDFQEMWQRAAGVVDKVLRGAKPADIPAEQPTRFRLAINLRTARAIGLEVPQSIVQRADEVIE